MDLSVVICSHNPRPSYLCRVLEALKVQTLPQKNWELLLIDNASDEVLASQWDLSWHQNARILKEDRLGKTQALLLGIQEHRGDVMMVVDDDNVLANNYLAEALRIGREWPMVGAWGGQPTPEFESTPPAWMKPYLPQMGLCRTERDCWSNNYDSYCCPIGAGMCIRRSVALRYCSDLRDVAGRIRLSRVGNGLLGGEDTDMAFTACDMGLGVGRFMSLNFVHLIPNRRLTLDYLLALREGMVLSTILLRSYRPAITPQSSMIRSTAGYLWRILRADKYERRFQLAAWRGERKARRLLAKQKNAASEDKIRKPKS